MRLLVLVIASLLLAGPCYTPVAFADNPAGAPAAAHLTAKAAVADTATAYKQAAESYRDLTAAAVVAIGATATFILGLIAAWKQIRKALKEQESKTAEAVIVATDVAAEAKDQIKAVHQTVVLTAQQVSVEGDSTLRSIVQRQGELIQSHADNAAEFRRQMLEAFAHMSENVNQKMDAQNAMIMKIISKMANL